jgi:peroxiredoxin
MSGLRGKDKIFIVDENNNKDFRDDSIRPFQKLDWRTIDNLIKCKYNIYDGKKMIIDSTWVNIGFTRGDKLLFFVSHHLISTFSINQDKFQVAVFDDQSKFAYDDPMIALINENGIKKDSLLKSEIFVEGEYLKLGGNYYLFDDISNDGSIVTLVKEDNVSDKIGTQIGFIAPEFKSHTTEGDTVELKKHKGSYLLLANVSACYSKISSYKCYKDLTEAYSTRIKFLGIDNSPNFLQQNIKELNLKGQFIIAEDNNSSIQKSYRPDYCSRTCFLINPDGRIIDKFEIFDWEQAMSKHFNLEK